MSDSPITDPRMQEIQPSHGQRRFEQGRIAERERVDKWLSRNETRDAIRAVLQSKHQTARNAADEVVRYLRAQLHS